VIRLKDNGVHISSDSGFIAYSGEHFRTLGMSDVSPLAEGLGEGQNARMKFH